MILPDSNKEIIGTAVTTILLVTEVSAAFFIGVITAVSVLTIVIVVV